MKQYFTKIGDHIILINTDLKYPNQSFLKNFHPYISSKNLIPDLHINIKDGYGVPFVDYKVDITTKGDKVVYRRADYKIETETEYKSADIAVYDDFALKHALLNLYSAFLVHHQWGLLIHSSCVIEKGKAHIFAGQSGAGKSTAAKLSFPRQLLSDEATLVKISPDEVKVFNSPFRSELKADKFDDNKELASIQILYQALTNTRLKLAKSDALIHLLDKVFYWPHSQEEVKTIHQLMTMLVKNVRVYNLHFQKNNTFWELIS